MFVVLYKTNPIAIAIGKFGRTPRPSMTNLSLRPYSTRMHIFALHGPGFPAPFLSYKDRIRIHARRPCLPHDHADTSMRRRPSTWPEIPPPGAKPITHLQSQRGSAPTTMAPRTSILFIAPVWPEASSSAAGVRTLALCRHFAKVRDSALAPSPLWPCHIHTCYSSLLVHNTRGRCGTLGRCGT